MEASKKKHKGKQNPKTREIKQADLAQSEPNFMCLNGYNSLLTFILGFHDRTNSVPVLIEIGAELGLTVQLKKPANLLKRLAG